MATTVRAKHITNLTLSIQSGTTNSLYAHWKDPNNVSGRCDGWEVHWAYNTGDGHWYDAGTSTVSITSANYSIPDNALSVRCIVYSVPRTYSVKSGSSTKDVAYYSKVSTGNTAIFDVTKYGGLGTPGSPSIDQDSWNGSSAIIRVIISADVMKQHPSKVQVEVIRDLKTYVGRLDMPISKVFDYNSSAEVAKHYTFTPGHNYKLRARCIRGNIASDWTEYTEEISSAPAAPSRIKSIAINSSDGIVDNARLFISWTPVSNAEQYTLQYSNNRTDLENNISGSITEVSITKSTGQTSPNAFCYLTAKDFLGKTYYFRVCSVKGELSSTFTSIKEFTVSAVPDPPTIWASSYKNIINDEEPSPIIYWTHNSNDGSDLTKSRITIAINIDGKDKMISVDVPRQYTEKSILSGAQSEQVVNSIQKYTLYNYNDSDDPLMKALKSMSEYSSATHITLTIIVKTAGIGTDSSGNLIFSDNSEQIVIDLYTDPKNLVRVESINDSGEYEDTDTPNLYPIRLISNVGTSDDSNYFLGAVFKVIANETYETTDELGNVETITKGDVVFSKSFNSSNFSYINRTSGDYGIYLTPGNVRLENGYSYIFTSIASFGCGVQKEASKTFSLVLNSDYELPQPDAEVLVDTDNLTVSLRPYCVNYDESTKIETPVKNVELSVYRINYDGTFTEIESNIPNIQNGNITSIFVTDPHPSLGLARYRIVATKTDSGIINYTDIYGIEVPESAIVLQWNDEWSPFDTNDTITNISTWSGTMLRLPYNIDISSSHDPDTELIEYIGREHPVSYYGTQIGETASWNTEIPKTDNETLYAIRKLSRWMGDVYVREPSGSGYWANVKVSYNVNHLELTVPISFDITRVEGGI